MTKEPERKLVASLYGNIAGALLYFMLNEGNEKIDEEEHNE